MISRRTFNRVIYSLVTLWAAITITFVVLNSLPIDPVDVWAREYVIQYGYTYEDAYDMVKAMYPYKLESPMWVRYFEYIGNLFRGNLGYSMAFLCPVNEIVVKCLPWTLFVLSFAITISFAVGCLLGMLAAWKRRGFLDAALIGYASFTHATPNFLVAILLFIFLAARYRLFPLGGAYDPSLKPGFNVAFIGSVLYHAALPILSYVIEHIGAWILLMRGSAISVLEEDYVRAAVARGLKDKRIMTAYVGRNAILAPLALLAITFGYMIGGSTLVETVFRYPGIGYFFAEAVSKADYGLMQGLFFLLISAVIMANLVVELIYPILDPRVREEG